MSGPVELAAELVVDQGAHLGEGPLWDGRRGELLWVDVLGAKLFSYNPATGSNAELDLSSRTRHVTTAVPVRGTASEVVVGTTAGIARVDVAAGAGSYAEHPHSGRIPGHGEFVRMNDGKCDPQGRLWIGSISRQGPGGADLAAGGAAFYCYDGWRDAAPARVLGGVTVSNGVSWSPDGRTMYYTDSPTFHVDALDFDGSKGEPRSMATNRRQIIKASDSFPPVPDGHAVDTDGMLWVACFGAGEVRRYDPETGEVRAVARVPAGAGKEATACAFGGDDLDELYITTAHEFWDGPKIAQFPHAGGLYKVSRDELKKAGHVRGAPPNHFNPAGSASAL
mmetsp:Transcript_78927/g.223366  ORF Transcript_78927/g.223366 Transcript_78927/m.223366 type:complete len:337 (-) Transcript_78927:161-1171(-)